MKRFWASLNTGVSWLWQYAAYKRHTKPTDWLYCIAILLGDMAGGVIRRHYEVPKLSVLDISITIGLILVFCGGAYLLIRLDDWRIARHTERMRAFRRSLIQQKEL